MIINSKSLIYHLIATTVFVIVPLAYLDQTLDPAFAPRTIVLAFFNLLFSMYILIKKKQEHIRYTNPALVYFVFVIISFLSVFIAINQSEAFFTALTYANYFAFFLILIHLIDDVSIFFGIISKYSTVAVLIIVVLAIMQFLNVSPIDLPGGTQPFGLMGHKNLLSSWLFLNLPFILFSTISSSSRNWKLFSYLVLISTAFCMTITQTRSVWVASSIAMLFFLTVFFINKQKLNLSYKKVLLPFLLITAVMAITIFNPPTQHYDDGTGKLDLKTRMMSVADAKGDTAANQRLIAWKQTIYIAQDNLLLGVGGGNWTTNLPKYGLEMFYPEIQAGYNIYLETHNDFLSILSEHGVFGLIAYAGFFIYLLLYALRTTRKNPDSELMIIALLVMSTIIGYAVISVFDFPKDRVEHNIMFMLLAAIISLPFSKKLKADVKNAFVFILIMSLIVIIFASYRISSEYQTQRALVYRANHQWDNVHAEIDEAYSPVFSTIDPVNVPLPYYKGEAYYMQNKPIEALVEYNKALKLFPYYIHVFNDMGACYYKMQNYTEALSYFNKALEISPNFQDALMNVAAVHYNMGNYRSAYNAIIRCDTSENNPKGYKYYQAIVKKLQGNN